MKKVSLLILVSMILLLAFTSCDVLPETVTGPLDNVKNTVVDTFNNVKETVVGTFNNVKDKVEIALGLHEHEWTDATCTSPKTCRCGETEGEALGHNYSDATCTEPQTCKNCGETLGSALQHNWVDATCTDPKTCLRCDATEGEALGHDWQAPSCTAPRTCAECGETDGEALGHTIVNATCTEPQHCSACDYVGEPALGHEWTEATCTNPVSECDRCHAPNPDYEVTHTRLVHMEAVEAGCHYDGNIEYWICYDCETVWADEALTQLTNIKNVIVPAKGSDLLVHMDAVEPGCHYDGNIEYWICYECEQVWADEALTQLTNVKNVILPAVGSDLLVHMDAVEPGCHYTGNIEYWICYECEQVWADEALTQLTNIKNVVIPELGGEVVHVEAVEVSCHQNGNIEYWYCEGCEQVWADEARTQLTNFRNVIVPFDSENIVHEEAKAATCYENGYAEHWYCKGCDMVWIDAALTQVSNRRNIVVPAGHTNLVHMDAVEPACHYNGNVEYWICYGCEGVWTDEALTQVSNVKNVILPAVGSDLLVHMDAVAPACHYTGNVEYWICYECEQVWADEALTQLTNIKNVVVPELGGDVVHVDAVAPTCTENGNIEHWYCEECGQVWADEARTQLTNRMNVILPPTHTWIDATCDAPMTCSICGETDGEPLASHTIKVIPEEGKYYCATCDAYYVVDNKVVFTGSEDFVYNVNGTMPNQKVDGAYSAIFTPDVDTAPEEAGQGWALNTNTGKLGAQPMYWIPSNGGGAGLKDFTCANGATGVISFTMKTSMTDPFTVAVAKERGASDWSGWGGSSINLFNISGAAGAETVVLTNVFATGFDIASIPVVDGWAEFSVEVFISLSEDNTMTVAYYVNGQFCNAISGEITTMDSYDIRALYINGWTYTPGTGIILDDIVFGSTTTSEWIFDGHKHVWGADADCENAQTCTLCGAVGTAALGHTKSEVKIENVVLPTCTATGSHEEVIHCTVCEKELSRETKVDAALGHDEAVVVPGYAATCTEPGLTDGANCSRCGITTKAQEIIPALDHIDEDLNEVCDRCEADLSCQHVDTETETVPGKAATCTEPGLTDGVKCLACGDWITAPEAIPAPGHTEAEAVRENVTAPTCTEAGKYDSVVYCSVCNTELRREVGVVDPALGHDEIAHEAQAPTCTEIGWEAYVTCSRCDYTTKVEIEAKGHSFASATCTAPETCTVCGQTQGEKNAENHVALVRKLVDDKNVYSCDCGYTFTVKIGDYSDGTNYNGISANAPNNTTYYTSNPDKANYPVLSEGGYLEFVRKTDAEGVANTTSAQLQLWLPTTGGANKYAGFTSANNAVGYLSFKINAYTDKNLEMKLVDNTTDYYDVNGDGVVDQATERIRWGDLWAINDPVFRVSPVTGGKAEIKGFDGVVLTTVDVDENNYTGWVDVAIQITLDPVSDTVIAKYFINGKYVATSSRPLSIHSNGINAVYLNSNNTVAGTGYQIDDLAFGYTAHEHDFSYVEENGTLVYTCPCGAEYSLLSEYREWNGDDNDAHFDHTPNGKVDTVYNEDGTWGFIFNPVADSDWANYGGPGGQFQPWMPSSNRNEHTLSGFSCENNAVGVIAFTMKTNVTRHADRDTNVTLGVGKPRGASDWNDSNGDGTNDSWTDDHITILWIEDYLETGVVIKGGVNSSMTLATIPVADGWSEWFDVMISIEMLDTGYMNTYYYINGVYCGTYSRDLSKADADSRYLDPKKIEAFQFSGWTYAANTGILFDDLVFGYTAGGHNTLDGQIHNLTETTCGEKSVCSCGWTGYTLDHDLTEATCGAPATCKVCGLTEGSALTHDNLTASTANGVTTYACSDCGKQYVADSHNLYYDGSAQVGSWSNNGDVTSTVVDGYNAVINKETDGTYFNESGNQFMTWIPSASTPAEFDGFTCANNAIGLASFKIKAYTDGHTGVEFKINDARGTSSFGWSTTSVGIFTIKPVTSADATTAEIRGLNGTALTTVPLAEGSKWTEWLDVALLIKLSDDNKISVDYYINSAFVGNITMDMLINTGKISSFYINGYTKGDDTGYYLDDLAFGYTLNGLQTPEEPFYTEEIAAENVTSETLKSIATDKIKQCDQTAPVYVLANGKDGAEVEALYFSHTTGWGESSDSNNYGFVENRWAVNANVTSISFDYIINGTLNGVSASSDGTWIDGTVVPLGNSLVQLKCGSTLNGVACDGYPELPNSSLTADGEWHTFTVSFDEPLDSISHFLVKLYNLDGEFLISNIVITYAE